ncbi:hypothetical protein NC661_06635 [Aquibacillus koreensis]|uniref:Uncharacterized protein n=1 Tax=Aquibacillus koreensis TaxID=279446 RepID=A0A9X3WHI9_9BACI|nr:hypothetical protein [Aquibacillus koreensis]MCT2535673.1 hypothetical protein [Aquibacillus koreensis]MDC3420042.1 hypothetical protein [Aquibacillus koreensis]
MSEKKKVIYVKDLVIKADNVVIESKKPEPRRVDPFFGPGPKRDEVVADEVEEEKYDKDDDDIEAVEDHEDDKDDKKRPFSWI